MRIVRIAMLLYVVIVLLLPASANNSTGILTIVSTLPVPVTVSSGSSIPSSSSGNGDVASDEPFLNIARSEKRWQDLRARQMTTYLFNLNIYKVEVMPLNNEFGVSIKIEELFNSSNSTPNAYNGNGEIYKYFNLNIGSRRINNATIYFTVPASDSTELLQWNMTKLIWDNIKTTKIDSTHYRANITGFSNFAIVIFKTPEPTITTPKPIITTKTPELPHTNIDENETNPSPPTAPPSNNGIIIIGALIIIILIYFIFIY